MTNEDKKLVLFLERGRKYGSTKEALQELSKNSGSVYVVSTHPFASELRRQFPNVQVEVLTNVDRLGGCTLH